MNEFSQGWEHVLRAEDTKMEKMGPALRELMVCGQSTGTGVDRDRARAPDECRQDRSQEGVCLSRANDTSRVSGHQTMSRT